MLTKIELTNGKTVEGSLSMAAMRQLRAKNKGLYYDTSRTVLQGTEDIDDVSKAIYASYLAVNNDDIIPQKEFIESLPDSMPEQIILLRNLMQ